MQRDPRVARQIAAVYGQLEINIALEHIAHVHLLYFGRLDPVHGDYAVFLPFVHSVRKHLVAQLRVNIAAYRVGVKCVGVIHAGGEVDPKLVHAAVGEAALYDAVLLLHAVPLVALGVPAAEFIAVLPAQRLSAVEVAGKIGVVTPDLSRVYAYCGVSVGGITAHEHDFSANLVKRGHTVLGIENVTLLGDIMFEQTFKGYAVDHRRASVVLYAHNDAFARVSLKEAADINKNRTKLHFAVIIRMEEAQSFVK